MAKARYILISSACDIYLALTLTLKLPVKSFKQTVLSNEVFDNITIYKSCKNIHILIDSSSVFPYQIELPQFET